MAGLSRVAGRRPDGCQGTPLGNFRLDKIACHCPLTRSIPPEKELGRTHDQNAGRLGPRPVRVTRGSMR
jgi:hypothetical protein